MTLPAGIGVGAIPNRARFEREARTLAALSNPHIAAIHDIIDVGDHRAIVMELVDGPRDAASSTAIRQPRSSRRPCATSRRSFERS